MEFNISFEVKSPDHVERVKSFVKEFFSFIDFSSENIDSSSYDNIVCGESLPVDVLFKSQQEMLKNFILNLGCDFVRKLASLGADINEFYVLYEEIFVGVGSIKDGSLEYTAALCEEEARLTENEEWIVLPNKKVTGSVAEGFVETDIPFSYDLFRTLCDQLY